MPETRPRYGGEFRDGAVRAPARAREFTQQLGGRLGRHAAQARHHRAWSPAWGFSGA